MTEKIVDNKRLARNTLFLYTRTFVIMLVSLFTSREILSVLGETDFGIYNLVGGIVVMFSFMNTAMSAATQRYLSFELGKGNNEEVGRVFSMSVNVHMCIALFILLLGESIGLWFVKTQLNIPQDRQIIAICVYQLSLIGCCINVLRIPYNATIIAYERMSFYAYVSIFEASLKLAIVYLLYIGHSDRLLLYAFYMLLVIVILNIVHVYYCRKHFSTTKYRWFWDKVLCRKLLTFSGWSMFGGLANTTANQGMSILLNIFYNVSLNAAMGIAHQVNVAMHSFIGSFQTAFNPQIVKCYAANQKEEFINLISKASRFSYCMVFLIALPVIFCIKPILNLWLTEVPNYTESFVIIYILYSMIDALSGPLWVSVQATGDIKKYQILMSAFICLNIPIMYILLLMGCSPILVVAVRTIINLVIHIVRILYLKGHIGFPVYTYMKDVMLRVFIMSLLSLPLPFLLMRNHTTSFKWACFVFVFILMQNILLTLFIGIKQSERTKIICVIKQKIYNG